MLNWIFRKPRPATPQAIPAAEPSAIAVDMHWRAGTRLPIPDWGAISAGVEGIDDDVRLHAWYTASARQWLDALGRALPDGDYASRSSADFLLLSAQPARAADLVLRSCEQALRAVRGRLGALAADGGYGPYVVIVFASQDSYYDYVSHYHDDGGEYAMSSGVFINAGYGHFASWHDALDQLEPVVVHELTHALLTHLPLPLWLNEGIAVNVERALLPRLADPRLQLHTPAEMHARHLGWWNAETIQAFWSGEAFQVGEGVELAYDLARTITALAARDEAAFHRFALAATWQDAGKGAEPALGFPLVHLVEAVLGEGEWTPRPGVWRQP